MAFPNIQCTDNESCSFNARVEQNASTSIPIAEIFFCILDWDGLVFSNPRLRGGRTRLWRVGPGPLAQGASELAYRCPARSHGAHCGLGSFANRRSAALVAADLTLAAGCRLVFPSAGPDPLRRFDPETLARAGGGG